MFIGKTDVEAETPIFWPPHVKSWFVGKDPDAGKVWGQEEKGMTDEMVGWHHRLNGHESGWTLGVGDGQGGLACCCSWGCKELDTTGQLSWTDWGSGGALIYHSLWILISFRCLPLKKLCFVSQEFWMSPSSSSPSGVEHNHPHHVYSVCWVVRDLRHLSPVFLEAGSERSGCQALS